MLEQATKLFDQMALVLIDPHWDEIFYEVAYKGGL